MLDLNKSYRTTVNISDASNLILNHLGQNNSECVARMGDEVVTNDDISEVTLISQIKSLLDKEYQSMSFKELQASLIQLFHNDRVHPDSLIHNGIGKKELLEILVEMKKRMSH